jgi:hypothetical protein
MITWAGHITPMGQMRNAYKVFIRKCEGKIDHVEDLGTDTKIMLKWILGKYGGKVWTGIRTGTGGELL